MEEMKKADENYPDKLRQEEVRLRIQKMRQEREARQAARIQLLKSLNLQKTSSQSIFLGSNTSLTEHNIERSFHSKSLNLSAFDKTKSRQSKAFHNTTSGDLKASCTIPISKKLILPTVSKMTVNNSDAKISNTAINVKPSAVKLKTADAKSRLTYHRIDTDMKNESKIRNHQKMISTDKNVKTNENKLIIDHSKKLHCNGELQSKKGSNSEIQCKKASAATFERLSRPKHAPNAILSSKDSKIVSSTNLSEKKDVGEKTTKALNDKKYKPNTLPKSNSVLKSNPVPKPKKSIVLKKSILDNSSAKSVAPMPKTFSDKPIVSNTKKNDSQSNNMNFRRSLSTVHFKRLGSDAAKGCLKRTNSLGSVKYKEIEEELASDFPPKDYVLTVGSEKKKSVSFFTPMRKSSTPNAFLNTPKPSELRKRLNDWLQRRGKSISNFHHLKCFGMKNVEPQAPSNIANEMIEEFNDDDKENVEISDNESFHENMTGDIGDNAAAWRQAYRQSSECLSTPGFISPKENNKRGILAELTPGVQHESDVDPLVSDALFDLHQLILEDYSWLQCAEWLRSIVRNCGENVKNISAYWECRAALEEKRGNFVYSVDCFNNALQRGAQQSNIEDALDHLLEKFMKLELHPGCQEKLTQITNPKLIDVKNVFKSSLIRFAIKRQTRELTEEKSSVPKKYTATPVRRSSRLSCVDERQIIWSPKNDASLVPGLSSATRSGRKHLMQLSESLRNVDDDIKRSLIFIPNKALNYNDCM